MRKKGVKTELPRLTDKQMKFVEGVQKGLKKSEAYRYAYNTETMTKESIWVAASRLASNANVSLWLDSIRREAIRRLNDEASYTLQDHINELNDLIEDAKKAGAWAQALGGIQLKGKATNKYTSHSEINVNNAPDKQLLERLEAILGHEAMVSAAERLGYSLEDIQLSGRRH